MSDIRYPQRKSPRLQGYDYSHSGAYFVTICAYQRTHLFGTIDESNMILNPAGQIALERWFALPDHHPGTEIDAVVIMPNHVHAIVLVGTMPALSDSALSTKSDTAGLVPTAITLGTIVGSYKSGVTRRIREILQDSTLIIWQGRYHDHIIRDERGLETIRDYILNNPSRWHEDTFYTT